MIKKEIPPLAAYVSMMESMAQPLSVTLVVHPEATDGGVYVGLYAGIRTVKGDVPAAQFSDGTKH